jgi:hypothetical protein
LPYPSGHAQPLDEELVGWWSSKIPVGVAVTKKQAKIPDRVYPRDLYGILQGLWDNKPFFRGWPNVELPPKAVFDEIIDVCYHASMLTEEGRPTVFRIVFLDSQSPVSPRDDDELPPVTRYPLKEPVPFRGSFGGWPPWLTRGGF